LAGHVARVEEMGNAYRNLVGIPEAKRPTGRFWSYIRTNLKQTLKRCSSRI